MYPAFRSRAMRPFRVGAVRNRDFGARPARSKTPGAQWKSGNFTHPAQKNPV
jgi:hypothetical protein